MFAGIITIFTILIELLPVRTSEAVHPLAYHVSYGGPEDERRYLFTVFRSGEEREQKLIAFEKVRSRRSAAPGHTYEERLHPLIMGGSRRKPGRQQGKQMDHKVLYI